MIEEIIEKAKKENKKIYIYAHKFPDGDAISSSRALAEYLKLQGIDARYVVTTDVKEFNNIVGDIPITRDVDENEISIILDTSTVSYAENRLFKKSSPENTYVIDHHGKTNGSVCIEDELQLPKENVIRNSEVSSVCELLVNELQHEEISPQIANMLTLGLLTDTAKLKFLKANTLPNLSKLIEIGADYESVLQFCSRKSNLREEVGIAKTLLKSKRFQIGDTFGIILPLIHSEVDTLNKQYGIRNPQKKIFKMSDIENCSFNCMFAENTPNEFNLEFRSTPIYGNFNVLQLATSHGGGGHYNASGCPIKASDGYTKSDIVSEIEQQAIEMYSQQATNLKHITLTEQDHELRKILDDTNRLSRRVTPEILGKVNELIKAGANYEYTLKTFKTYERFMLENEILSRIPSETYTQINPNVLVSLSPQDVEMLNEKYQVSENDILSVIDTFSNINISSATIILSNGKKASINCDGIITTEQPQQQNNNLDEISI